MYILSQNFKNETKNIIKNCFYIISKGKFNELLNNFDFFCSYS